MKSRLDSQPDSRSLLARALFVFGMLLMPISTGPRRGVVSLGLPFLALLGLLYIMQQLAYPQIPRWERKIALYAFLLIAAIGITTLYAVAPFASFARFLPNAIGFFVFLMMLSPFFDNTNSEESYEFTIKVIVASGAIVALYYLANFAFAVATIGVAAVFLDRVTGGIISLPWGATNVVASVLLFPLFMTFYFPNKEPKKKSRYIYLIARFLMLAAIAATISRGAILSAGFGMIVLATFLRGKARARAVLFIVIASGVLFYANQQLNEVMSQQVVSALVNRFQDSDVKDMNGRLELWGQFGSAFVQSPLLGLGYYSSLYYFQMSGHNLFLTSLVERGIIGFALSAALPIKAAETLFVGLRRSAEVNTRLVFACMTAGGLASMLHLMIEDANFTQQYIVYSWVGLGLVFQVAQVVRKRASESEAVPGAPTLSFES